MLHNRIIDGQHLVKKVLRRLGIAQLKPKTAVYRSKIRLRRSRDDQLSKTRVRTTSGTEPASARQAYPVPRAALKRKNGTPAQFWPKSTMTVSPGLTE